MEEQHVNNNPFTDSSSKSTSKLSPPIGSSVIPIVNKLQDIFAPFGDLSSSIKLPQVAVVGSQSSGKSSVLEALVGRDFLPRGSDICTRCPLILQLENRSQQSDVVDDGPEWGEFLHLPKKRFYDFAAIRREIEAETERLVGSKKGVSDKEIHLKISSPNVLNIFLVDLPGIAEVPVGGQTTDIEAKIRAMIMSYIKRETCIILAVTPSNTDVVSSEALQLAKSVDPDGSRTLRVITKLDIMDKDANAHNFLLGKAVPLHLGYSGADIIQNRSIAEALASEENFFCNHPVYHGLLDRCDLPQLAKRLKLILEQNTRTVLASLKAKKNFQIPSVGKDLQTHAEIKESKVGSVCYCDDKGTSLAITSTEYSIHCCTDGQISMGIVPYNCYSCGGVGMKCLPLSETNMFCHAGNTDQGIDVYRTVLKLLARSYGIWKKEWSTLEFANEVYSIAYMGAELYDCSFIVYGYDPLENVHAIYIIDENGVRKVPNYLMGTGAKAVKGINFGSGSETYESEVMLVEAVRMAIKGDSKHCGPPIYLNSIRNWQVKEPKLVKDEDFASPFFVDCPRLVEM